jgi:hypothetical protein
LGYIDPSRVFGQRYENAISHSSTTIKGAEQIVTVIDAPREDTEGNGEYHVCFSFEWGKQQDLRQLFQAEKGSKIKEVARELYQRARADHQNPTLTPNLNFYLYIYCKDAEARFYKVEHKITGRDIQMTQWHRLDEVPTIIQNTNPYQNVKTMPARSPNRSGGAPGSGYTPEIE